MSKEEKVNQQAKILEMLLHWIFTAKQLGLDIEFLREAVNNFNGHVSLKESFGVMFNINAIDEADILDSKSKVLRAIIALYECLDDRDKITTSAQKKIEMRTKMAELI